VTAQISFFQKYRYVLLLIGTGLLVYFNSLFGSYIWDDISFLRDNAQVHSLSNIPSFFFGGTVASQNGLVHVGSYYRPLHFSFWAVEYFLSGNQTFLYHFVQLIIHISNTLLIFVFLKKFFKEKLAFFLSLFFLIHPVNSESVAYMSAMGDPLMFLFGIFALIVYQKAKNIKNFLAVGFLLLCSIFSKETGIVFFGITFVYGLLFKHNKKSLISTFLIITLPFLFYIFLRFIVAGMPLTVEKIPDVPMMTATMAQRLFTMPAIFWFYIKTFFFPKDLFTFQEWMVAGPTIDFYIPLLLDILFIAVVTGFGLWIWETNKKQILAYIFFAIWLFIGIGIHIQFLPLDMTVAHRYFYFGEVGLIGLLGVIIQNAWERNKNLRTFGITIAIILIVILSLRTIIRNSNWYNGISLYAHDLQFEKNDRMENLLAADLVNAGMYQEAQIRFENLLTRNPKEPALYANLALTYEITGDFMRADQTYSKGLHVDDSGTVYANYSRFLLERQGKIIEAKKIAEEGLSKFPQNASLWILKAFCNYKLGAKIQALNDAKKAKTILQNPAIESLYQTILNNQPL
jgi:Tfp pilus assembly protein PilF